MVNRDNLENRLGKLEIRARKTGGNQRKYKVRDIQRWGLAGWKPEKDKGGRDTRMQEKAPLKWLSLGSGLARQGIGSGRREFMGLRCWK